MSDYCSRPNCFVESPHEHIPGSTLNDVINYHMAKCLTPQCNTYIASGGHCGQCNRETATIQSTLADLRAENERLTKDRDEWKRCSKLLASESDAFVEDRQVQIEKLEAENERLRKAESIIASRRFALIQRKNRGGLIMEERAVLDALTEIAREIAPPRPPLPDALKGAQ